LADDSGLEVEALNGEPGVHSARYAGLGAGDKAIVEKLLKEMNGLSMEKRRARFVCEICVNDPGSKQNIFASGLCSGYIAFEPKGDNGFGYDPVFIPDAYELTMAELEPKIKNSISHRAKALAVLKRKLKIK
jgi:XTP/dITP diphosphohydrolase